MSTPEDEATGDALSPRQQLGLVALMEQPTLAAAARVLETSESTLRRWLKEPAFSAELKAMQSAALDAAMARVMGLSGSCVEALREVMESPLSTPAARVAAAGRLLELALRQSDADELRERLEDLEREQRGHTRGSFGRQW